MIGLDTNVLVRYVVQDHAEQSAAATAVIEGLDEEKPGFVSVLAVVELHWVLRRAYQVSADQAAGVIRTLLNSAEIVVQASDEVRRAINRQIPSTDFADALIAELGTAAGCDATVTLDRAAARIPAVRLIRS